MSTRRGGRPTLWMLIVLGVLATAGCNEVADLIPGDSANPPAEAAATAQADSTPILVTPTLGVAATRTPTPQSTIPDHELAHSVVQVLPTDLSAGFARTLRDGSGIVVDGGAALILTSYPVVAPFRADGVTAYSYIVIATNRETGSPPIPEYRAEIVAADVATGLAVLRVTARADGSALASGDFELPAVRIGDATRAAAGLQLRLFGHPGVGASTAQAVSVTQGSVSGLRGDAGRTGRSAFKLETSLPYGVAGGPAFDPSGSLIGILVQDHYAPTGEVGQVRPIDLATPLIEAARGADPGSELQPPLMRTSLIPGSSLALLDDGVWVSRPSFAESAVENAASRDLFDYETSFPAGIPSLFYEYVIQGASQGALVEERWFLDGIQQDTLSSSVAWDGRRFGIVSDRITSPGAAGIPAGRWRIEVWVGGALRATATAIIGVPLSEVVITQVGGGTAATPEGNILTGVFSGAGQLLAFFDYSGMEGVRQIQWHVFRDNQRIYISPIVKWQYGDAGRFWIGLRDGTPITPGLYEFEIHIEDRIAQILQVRVF